MNLGASSANNACDKESPAESRATPQSAIRQDVRREQAKLMLDYTAGTDDRGHLRATTARLAQPTSRLGIALRSSVVPALLGRAAGKRVRVSDAGGCRGMADLRVDRERAGPWFGRARAIPAVGRTAARRRARRGSVCTPQHR